MNLLRNRNFLLLTIGAFASSFGDLLRAMALTYWILQGSQGSPLARTVQLVLGVLPALLLGPLAGVFSDRWNKRRIMLLSDLLRMLISLGLMAAFAWHSLTLTYVCIVTSAAIAVFFEPARFSLVRTVVKDASDLSRANALTESGMRLLTLLGPATATAIYFVAGGAWAFAIDSVTFGVSALTVFAVHLDSTAIRPEVDEEHISISAFWREALAGFSYLRGNVALMLFMVTTTGLMLTATTNQVSLVFLLIDALHRPASDLAWVLAVSGGAQMVAALAVAALGKRIRPAPLLVGCMAAIAVSQIGMGLAPTALVFGIWVLLGALVNAPYSIAYDTTLQQTVEEQYMGRVYSLDSAIGSGLNLLILSSAGILTATIGPRFAVTGAGLLSLVFAGVGFLGFLPAMRRAPASPGGRGAATNTV